jgi:hypothetical protein
MGDLRSYPVCAVPVRGYWRRPVVSNPSHGPAGQLPAAAEAGAAGTAAH